MPAKSLSKLTTLRLALFAMFLMVIFGTAVLGQTAQTTPKNESSNPPVSYTPVGTELKKQPQKSHAEDQLIDPRAAVAYTPVNGITVVKNPDTDNNDPAPETSPDTPDTPDTPPTSGASHRPKHKNKVNTRRQGKIRPKTNSPVTIAAGAPFTLTITTGKNQTTNNSYSEHKEWGTGLNPAKIYDPFVTVKLFKNDGTPVCGHNQATDTKLRGRLRLISGESNHTLPLYGRFFATKSLFKNDPDTHTASLPLDKTVYVLHIFRHLQHTGTNGLPDSNADQKVEITVN